MRKPAVFLDRDGVINRKMPEGQYVLKPADFVFLPGVFDAIRILKINDYLVIVTTNQRCIAKNLIAKNELEEIHRLMLEKISRQGGAIDAVYYCPHEISEGCGCRKPQAGLIFRAEQDFKGRDIEITLQDSYMVGDAESDILAGMAAGLKTIKIGAVSTSADFRTEGLYEAVRIIISNK